MNFGELRSIVHDKNVKIGWKLINKLKELHDKDPEYYEEVCYPYLKQMEGRDDNLIMDDYCHVYGTAPDDVFKLLPFKFGQLSADLQQVVNPVFKHRCRNLRVLKIFFKSHKLQTNPVAEIATDEGVIKIEHKNLPLKYLIPEGLERLVIDQGWSWMNGVIVRMENIPSVKTLKLIGLEPVYGHDKHGVHKLPESIEHIELAVLRREHPKISTILESLPDGLKKLHIEDHTDRIKDLNVGACSLKRFENLESLCYTDSVTSFAFHIPIPKLPDGIKELTIRLKNGIGLGARMNRNVTPSPHLMEKSIEGLYYGIKELYPDVKLSIVGRWGSCSITVEDREVGFNDFVCDVVKRLRVSNV